MSTDDESHVRSHFRREPIGHVHIVESGDVVQTVDHYYDDARRGHRHFLTQMSKTRRSLLCRRRRLRVHRLTELTMQSFAHCPKHVLQIARLWHRSSTTLVKHVRLLLRNHLPRRLFVFNHSFHLHLQLNHEPSQHRTHPDSSFAFQQQHVWRRVARRVRTQPLQRIPSSDERRLHRVVSRRRTRRVRDDARVHARVQRVINRPHRHREA